MKNNKDDWNKPTCESIKEQKMLDQPCVTVVIPVYNAEEYLERCISSVISQSHANLEIILVDDGSTDNSKQICIEWEKRDRRVIVIRQDNAGPGAARNAGIKAAKSEYVTFLDADDWFESTYVEKIVNAMINDGSDVGLCDIFYVDSSTLLKDTIKLRFTHNVVSSKVDQSVLNKSRLFAWGKIFKTELFSVFDFSFPKIAYEDTLMPVLIAGANQISYIPVPLINYFRNRQGSLSNDLRNIGDIKIALVELYKKLEKFKMLEEFILEYKKIAIGQLRFACRKCEITVDVTVKEALVSIEDYIVSIFPELNGLSQKKCYPHGGRLLTAALDNSLPYAAQVITEAKDADYILAFENEQYRIPASNGQIITIPSLRYASYDRATNEFNIAEQIMERLF